jgi:hypothetical protein
MMARGVLLENFILRAAEKAISKLKSRQNSLLS